LADFEVFKWNSENTPKVLEEVPGQQGFDQGFDLIFDQGCVDLIKRVTSDRGLGFRGDDPGGPQFD
jgi:hypothetical protein